MYKTFNLHFFRLCANIPELYTYLSTIKILSLRENMEGKRRATRYRSQFPSSLNKFKIKRASSFISLNLCLSMFLLYTNRNSERHTHTATF